MCIKVLIIIAAHNRRDTTLVLLASLRKAKLPRDVDIRICVIDDGSVDGTSESIAERFPEVIVYRTDGSLYWSGCVRFGIDIFFCGNFSHLLHLNDDLQLEEDCLSQIFDAARDPNNWIISATTINNKGKIIYGGLIRRPFFRFRLGEENDYENGRLVADTVNGNCLLVSRSALEAFVLPGHGISRQEAMEMNLGLEATRLGHPPLVLREALCRANPNADKFWFYRNTLPIYSRIKGILGPKGLPPRMYWDLCWRFAGPLAPLAFVRPYIHVLFARRR